MRNYRFVAAYSRNVGSKGGSCPEPKLPKSKAARGEQQAGPQDPEGDGEKGRRASCDLPGRGAAWAAAAEARAHAQLAQHLPNPPSQG